MQIRCSSQTFWVWQPHSTHAHSLVSTIRLTGTMKSSSFTHVLSSPQSLAARFHWCHADHFHYSNNGWTFSGQNIYKIYVYVLYVICLYINLFSAFLNIYNVYKIYIYISYAFIKGLLFYTFPNPKKMKCTVFTLPSCIILALIQTYNFPGSLHSLIIHRISTLISLFLMILILEMNS